MWPCKYCGHKNDETLTICKNCGALRDENIGDSGDNKDSEDLFFDDEGFVEPKMMLWFCEQFNINLKLSDPPKIMKHVIY